MPFASWRYVRKGWETAVHIRLVDEDVSPDQIEVAGPAALWLARELRRRPGSPAPPPAGDNLKQRETPELQRADAGASHRLVDT
jgi:hypothetical protein